MSKKNGNKDGGSPTPAMFFRLNFCRFDDDLNIISTGVCIDFDLGTITFSNPVTPVDQARKYVSQLPSFFGIRSIIILSDVD